MADAQASAVHVDVVSHMGRCMLRVLDDGLGMNVDQLRKLLHADEAATKHSFRPSGFYPGSLSMVFYLRD